MIIDREIIWTEEERKVSEREVSKLETHIPHCIGPSSAHQKSMSLVTN